MLKENTPLIETQRLILRRFDERDIQDILLIYGDEQANEFLPWFPIKTLKKASEYLYNAIFPCYAQDIAYCYAIALKADDRAIGYVHIHDIGGANDLGYGLRKEFWNQGIATEACLAIADRLKKAGFPFITATHDINNPGSGKVMEKLGMTYRYSYDELWQPKNFMVTFRMYQRNFDGEERTYDEYKHEHTWFVEQSK